MKNSICLPVLLCVCLFPNITFGEEIFPEQRTVSLHQLKHMTRCELEQLYRAGRVCAIPQGFVQGTPLFSPGTKKTARRAKLTRIVWKGKIFRCDGTLINKVGCLEMFEAKVYHGESWFDDGPSVIMDYCETSRIARDLRDEIREIAPGLYLGISYLRDCPCPRFWTFFVLEVCPRGDCACYPLH